MSRQFYILSSNNLISVGSNKKCTKTVFLLFSTYKFGSSIRRIHILNTCLVIFITIKLEEGKHYKNKTLFVGFQFNTYKILNVSVAYLFTFQMNYIHFIFVLMIREVKSNRKIIVVLSLEIKIT